MGEARKKDGDERDFAIKETTRKGKSSKDKQKEKICKTETCKKQQQKDKHTTRTKTHKSDEKKKKKTKPEMTQSIHEECTQKHNNTKQHEKKRPRDTSPLVAG